MDYAVTPGPSIGPTWRVWIMKDNGELRLVCETSCPDRLAFAVGSIKKELGL